MSEEDIFNKYTKDSDTQTVPSYKMALSARKTPYVWPDFLGKDTDPMEYLAQLNIPGLWIFGAKDGSVPVDLSIDNLSTLSNTKPKYIFKHLIFFHYISGIRSLQSGLAQITNWQTGLSNPTSAHERLRIWQPIACARNRLAK